MNGRPFYDVGLLLPNDPTSPYIGYANAAMLKLPTISLYAAVQPPSIIRDEPVTSNDASEAR